MITCYCVNKAVDEKLSEREREKKSDEMKIWESSRMLTSTLPHNNDVEMDCTCSIFVVNTHTSWIENLQYREHFADQNISQIDGQY